MPYQGKLKSYSSHRGFGFISCNETFELHGQDVYLSQQQASRLGVAESMLGASVEFEIQLDRNGRPQARQLVHKLETCAAGKDSGEACDAGKEGQHVELSAMSTGRIRSYNEKNGYGFIECEKDTATDANRQEDVFFSRPQAAELELANGLFLGAKVQFTLVFVKGRPQARNLLWLCEPDAQEASMPWSGQAPLPHEVPVTDLAGDAALEEWFSDQRRCEYDLNRYAKALGQLSIYLEQASGAVATRNVLKQAKSMLRCPKCRQDELLTRPHVLNLLEEADLCWDQLQHHCHGALKEAVKDRLRPPPQKPTPLLMSKLRFTQDLHSKAFNHGKHSGQTIDWLVGRLQEGKVHPEDPEMILNVVHFHGEYRTLNNRHGVALARHAKQLEALSPTSSPLKCWVRVWPLVRGLCIDDGSNQDVARKFLNANSTSSDGTAIFSKSRRTCLTEVLQKVLVHVSNLASSVSEDDLGMHLVDAGLECPARIEISRRSDGKSNCHGWVTFSSPEAATRAVELHVPPLLGREVKLQIDFVSQADASMSVVSGGWILCRKCQNRCCPLMDTMLVQDMRIPRDGTPEAKFEPKKGYFCIGKPDSLINSNLMDHPDTSCTSFKLKQVNCAGCSSDLGNVQKTTAMTGEWSVLMGEQVVHFKCASVLLKLKDSDDMCLEPTKWGSMRALLQDSNRYLLSQLTMRLVSELMSTAWRNSGKDVRLIKRRSLS
eukprot:TRINITY_DN74090_c0_g1_i1.p1 TRINITY_DN74090_c0_g1~~TRINITY_DN74090_c0_g1_i1.p1  ORF type:complete len:732 (-),score=129.13 TRINITY_DN74090_c0_g1_i1:289-2439(-)